LLHKKIFRWVVGKWTKLDFNLIYTYNITSPYLRAHTLPHLTIHYFKRKSSSEIVR